MRKNKRKNMTRLMALDETGRCFDIYQFPMGLYIWGIIAPIRGSGKSHLPIGIHSFVPTGSVIRMYEYFRKLKMGIRVYEFDK